MWRLQHRLSVPGEVVLGLLNRSEQLVTSARPAGRPTRRQRIPPLSHNPAARTTWMSGPGKVNREGFGPPLPTRYTPPPNTRARKNLVKTRSGKKQVWRNSTAPTPAPPSGIALACSILFTVESVESADNRLQPAWMLGFRILNLCHRTFTKCGERTIRMPCTARLKSLPRHHHARRAMLREAHQ